MKSRKIKYADRRDVRACIEQLQAIIDGLQSGSLGLSHGGDEVRLTPVGEVDFQLRVDQLTRRETLKLELTWRRDAQREASAPDSTDPASAAPDSAPSAPISSEPPSAEPSVLPEATPELAPEAAEYQRLYAASRSLGSDGHWHLDKDQLIQALARAGVDALTQQELYSRALQADADRHSMTFSEHAIAALREVSLRQAPAAR